MLIDKTAELNYLTGQLTTSHWSRFAVRKHRQWQ